MKPILSYSALALRILLGVFFIFSGLAKLHPIEPFEYTLVDQGISPWSAAPYLARLIIGFEIFLGLALIAGFRLRKITYPATLSLLVLFTNYLILQIITQGNEGDCGCFGTYLQMTPLQSIVKNIILLAVTALLYIYPENKFAFNGWWLGILFLIGGPAYVFVVNAPDAYFMSTYAPEYKTGKIDYEKLPSVFSDSSQAKLNEGKKLLAFFSVTCPHCKQAAFKLSVMKRQYPDLPFFVYFWGDSTKIDKFIRETNLDLPYTFYTGPEFMRIVGGSVPAILLVEDGEIRERWDKITLDPVRVLKEFGH